MKIVQVLCHPRPESFNLALAATAQETLRSLGHEVFLHDLYKEGFDPVLGAPELARSYSLDGLGPGALSGAGRVRRSSHLPP